TLVYPSRGNTITGARFTLMWVDRQGTEQPLSSPSRAYASMRLSPDGGRAAFHLNDLTQTVGMHVWVEHLTRGTTTPAPFGGNNQSPVWTPDGQRLIYQSSTSINDQNGTLLSASAAGGGQPVTVMERSTLPAPTSISPDGKLVIGVRASGQTRSGHDIWVLPL